MGQGTQSSEWWPSLGYSFLEQVSRPQLPQVVMIPVIAVAWAQYLTQGIQPHTLSQTLLLSTYEKSCQQQQHANYMSLDHVPAMCCAKAWPTSDRQPALS